MNILIIGYYKFADGYLSYGQHFSKYFDTVSFFPLIELKDNVLHSVNSSTIEDIELCINGGNLNMENYTENLINYPVAKDIVIIAHNEDMLHSLHINDRLVIEYINSLKEKYNFKLIQLNWDPKLLNDDVSNYFDLCFYTDPQYLVKENQLFFNIGFSNNISYYYEDNEYKCDVSFIGTNLYTDNLYLNHDLNRKIILDTLYADKSIKLHVYGPEFLQDLYPDSYKGIISYNDCYKVFSNSKINLNISPLIDIEHNGHFYYSGRLPQIIGCNGIILSNNNYGDLLKPDIDYIYVNTIDELIPKIKRVTENDEYYNTMKENVISIKDRFNYDYLMEDFCNTIKDFNNNLSE
jgi:hypothetical protein